MLARAMRWIVCKPGCKILSQARQPHCRFGCCWHAESWRVSIPWNRLLLPAIVWHQETRSRNGGRLRDFLTSWIDFHVDDRTARLPHRWGRRRP